MQPGVGWEVGAVAELLGVWKLGKGCVAASTGCSLGVGMSEACALTDWVLWFRVG